MRTFLGYVLVAAVIAGLYSAVMFLPIYLDHFDAKDTANATFNQFRDLGVDGVRSYLVQQFNEAKWATHEETDEEGNVVVKPGLGLTGEDITVEFDENTKVLWVHLEYQRKVVLKPTDKVRMIKFVFDRKEKPPNVL